MGYLCLGHGLGESGDSAETTIRLAGLVYGCTEIPSEHELKLTQRPIFWAVLVCAMFLLLNVIFW